MSLVSNRGQSGIVSLIATLLVFVLIWALVWGEQLTFWGQQAIEVTEVTGLEAFLLVNLNLWVFVFLILGILAFFYYGVRG